MKKGIAKSKGKAFPSSPESIEAELYANVREYIANAREKVYVAANSAMVEAYWNVGREIVEKQGGAERAAYGDGLIDRLSAKLTAEFGPDYTRSNLRNMMQFYLMFPICHAVSGKLTWTHYRNETGTDPATQVRLARNGRNWRSARRAPSVGVRTPSRGRGKGGAACGRGRRTQTARRRTGTDGRRERPEPAAGASAAPAL